MAVAASGGLDSTALLHCTVRAAALLGIRVHALHVVHGLQPDAMAWRLQLEARVRRWARSGWPVDFHWRALDGQPGRGQSVEAWARAGRYAALAAMARELGCGLVLLAHHRRDQAETVLLQALRGAGAAGGAAMPRRVARQGVEWARPWLDQPRQALERYVQRHGLGFVQDPGNVDRRFDRNRIRHDVWPALEAAFAHAEAALAASARRSAEAEACLRELHEIDASACVRDGRLSLSAWMALSGARRAHLLRRFLSDSAPVPVPDSLVLRLVEELPGRSAGRWPLGTGWVCLYRGELSLATAPTQPGTPARGPLLDLSAAGWHAVPVWGGGFRVAHAACGGLPAGILARVECRARGGGERFSRGPGQAPRPLKKEFQHAGVPAWQRAGPLLYVEDRLLWVPGLGVDGAWHGRLGAEGLSLHWEPREAPDPG